MTSQWQLEQISSPKYKQWVLFSNNNFNLILIFEKKVSSHENPIWEKNFSNGTSLFESLMQAINITNIHVISCSKCTFQIKSIIVNKQHLPLTRVLGNVLRLLLLINNKWRTGIRYSCAGFKYFIRYLSRLLLLIVF